MRIFFSWSGTTSHAVAKIFADWLPSVIQNAKPFLSSEDIAKGSRWAHEVAVALQECSFGVIFLTRENCDRPWIQFEAGALSRALQARVSPFLFGLNRYEVSGPLSQFQTTMPEKAEVLRLLKSINDASGETKIQDAFLERTFRGLWPELETALAAVSDSDARPKTTPSTEDIGETLNKIVDAIGALGRRSLEEGRGKLRPILFCESSREALANLVHELKTPLSVITGYAQTLEADFDTIPDEECKRFLEAISKYSQRLSDFVADQYVVLSAAPAETESGRSDEGKMSCLKETIDPS